MKYICPVCKQAGLPNFRSKHIICPQCNSDLQPYLLLENIRRDKQQNKLLTWIGIAALAVIAVLSMFFYWRVAVKNNRLSITYKGKPAVPDTVKSSPSVTINPTEPSKAILDSSFTFTYTVKSGDYPAKLARIFFNDWKLYKKIEADNNLQQPYTLRAGQPLFIKLHR